MNELYQYVKDAGKILELYPQLLKVRHPSNQGGGSIYSYAVKPGYKRGDIEEAARIVLRNIKGTL